MARTRRQSPPYPLSFVLGLGRGGPCTNGGIMGGSQAELIFLLLFRFLDAKFPSALPGQSKGFGETGDLFGDTYPLMGFLFIVLDGL